MSDLKHKAGEGQAAGKPAADAAARRQKKLADALRRNLKRRKESLSPERPNRGR